MKPNQITTIIFVFCFLVAGISAHDQQQTAKKPKVHYKTIDFHKIIMIFLWGPIINISILMVYYRYRKYTQYFHMIVGAGAGIISIVTSVPRIYYGGYVTKILLHFVLGTVINVFILVQCILGVVAWRLKYNFKSSSSKIYKVKKCHRYLGFLLLAAAKIQIYLLLETHNKSTFLFLFGQVLFILFYFYREQNFPTLSKLQNQQYQNFGLREVSNLQQLGNYTTGNLAVFHNKIYNLDKIKNSHPAGYQIIKSVKGQDLERYLYGMYQSEKLPVIPTHSHSKKSIKLLGCPLAILKINQNLTNFIEDGKMEVTVASVKRINMFSEIYLVRLMRKDFYPFEYRPITEINQIGRFHCLTLNQKITRLYTSLWFLRNKNIEFMVRYYFDPNSIECSWLKKQSQQTKQMLPFLIKQYPKGKLTSDLSILKNRKNVIQLSCTRGQGLKLQTLKPGKVIIVVGGTGLFPFCDLIDLLFKNLMIELNVDLRKEILELLPVLQENPFKELEFMLYLAVQRLAEIPFITLHQISYLCKNSQYFKAAFKIKYQSEKQMSTLRDIPFQLLDNLAKFQSILKDYVENEDVSRVMICGPPKMNENLYAELRQTIEDCDIMIV